LSEPLPSQHLNAPPTHVCRELASTVGKSSDDNPLWLLNHRTRRRIILAIGDAGHISASALRSTLKISTGSLYYNLRQLEPFVAQDGRRNYYLTERGVEVYRMLKAGEALILDAVPGARGLSGRLFYTLINPVWLLGPIIDRPVVGVLVGALSALLTAALYVNGKVYLIGLHVYHLKRFDLWGVTLSVAGSMLLYYLYLSTLSTIYDEVRRRVVGDESRTGRLLPRIKAAITFNGDALRGLSIAALGLLPMSLYPLLLFIARVLGLSSVILPSGLVPTSLTANIALVVAQFISFLILTSMLSHVRGLRWHISALICLSLLYLSIVLQYILLGTIQSTG